MGKKRKRRKSSAYGVVVGIILVLSAYVYVATHDLIVSLLLIIIAIGVALIRYSE
jgi:hypothetical protein